MPFATLNSVFTKTKLRKIHKIFLVLIGESAWILTIFWKMATLPLREKGKLSRYFSRVTNITFTTLNHLHNHSVYWFVKFTSIPAISNITDLPLKTFSRKNRLSDSLWSYLWFRIKWNSPPSHLKMCYPKHLESSAQETYREWWRFSRITDSEPSKFLNIMLKMICPYCWQWITNSLDLENPRRHLTILV